MVRESRLMHVCSSAPCAHMLLTEDDFRIACSRDCKNICSSIARVTLGEFFPNLAWLRMKLLDDM